MAIKFLANILEDHSANFGQKEAISDGKSSLTYQDLNSSSDRFACYLMEKGVVKGDRIVFLCPKETVLFTAIFGTFKAGGIYVPLDPEWPISRLINIMEDLKPRVVVASQILISSLKPHLGSVLFFITPAEIWVFIKDKSKIPISGKTSLPEVSEKDVAYCLYTSGSTGKPKGVLIQYSCISSFFDSVKNLMGINNQSHCLNTSPLHFDVSLLDTFFPLYSGAWIRLYCELFLPSLLLNLISKFKITHFCAVSPILALMTDGGSSFDETNLSSLKTIMTGAESPDVNIVQKWLNKVTNLSIINGYGPTEATCVCVAYLINKKEPDRTKPYPIGIPLDGVKVLLLNDNQEVIREPRIKGELLISGAQVMKGYWNQPKETNHKLINYQGTQYYRSGDICEYLEDGNLFFVGRVDEEIKLSGYRINLNEILRNVEHIDFIKEAAVRVVRFKSNHRELALCLGPKSQLTIQKIFHIEERLAHELPRYFLPEYYFIFEQFPRLSSNKVDKGKMDEMIYSAVEVEDEENGKYFFQTKNGTFENITSFENL